MNRVAAGATLQFEHVDAAHVRVTGAIDFAHANAAVARTDELLGSGSDMTADLGGLARADSATLGVLLLWAARAATRGKRLRFAGVPADLRALAHLCDAELLLGIA